MYGYLFVWIEFTKLFGIHEKLNEVDFQEILLHLCFVCLCVSVCVCVCMRLSVCMTI